MNDRYQYGDDHGYPVRPPSVWLEQPGTRLVRLIEGSVNIELPFRYIRHGMTFELNEKLFKAESDAQDAGSTYRVRVNGYTEQVKL